MKQIAYQLLIVDDSPNWCELLHAIFEEDLEVSTAPSYAEGRRLLLENTPPFDVAIIDLRLDDTDPNNEDGLRLLHDIQEHQLTTKAIILTGYPSVQSARVAFKDLGAFEYLEKYPQGGLDIAALRKAVVSALGEQRVLLIEDDPRWQQMLVEILAEDGYQVDSVDSSEGARDLFQKHQYSVAIVDLKLGNETPDQGVDLLEYARQVTPRSSLVVVSGYGSAERVRDAFERGRTRAFIFKENFDPESFREKIRLARSFG